MPLTLDGTTGASLVESDALPFLVGQVCFFAMTTTPDGFLKCNGAAVSRTTYSDLFSAIGTTFGAGDGSTTFELPDLRGEFLRGWDDGRGVDSGRSFGAFQIDGYKAHDHDVNYWDSSGSGRYNAILDNMATPGNIVTTSTDVVRNVDGIHETRPRNIALLACIKY